MSQSIEDTISADDYQCIQTNRLGIPLAVYKQKIYYIRLLQISGLLLLVISIASLIALLVDFIIRPHLLNSLSPLLASLLGIAFLPPGIIGGLVLLILVPQEQSRHVIVCEYGLLQMRKKLRSTCTEMIFWKDIQSGNTFLKQDYVIRYGNGKKLTFSSAYQDIDGLMELIGQHIEGDGI